MTAAKRVPRLIAAFFALDAVVVALHPVLRSIESLPPGLRQLVNLNREANLPTWFSSMQWLCVAALLLAFAWRLWERSESGGLPLLVLGLLFLCLSLDEVAMIHERLGLRSDQMLPTGTRVDGPFHRTGIWMFVVGIPVLAIFAVFLRGAATRLRRAPGAFLRIAIGLAVVAVGAMIFDLLGNLSLGGEGEWRVIVEEGLELVGSTVVLWGSLELLHAHGLRFGAYEPSSSTS
jgi:hypothetical protein